MKLTILEKKSLETRNLLRFQMGLFLTIVKSILGMKSSQKKKIHRAKIMAKKIMIKKSIIMTQRIQMNANLQTNLNSSLMWPAHSMT